MNIQDTIVYIIVFLCIIYAGKHFFRFFKKRKNINCNSGCSNCGFNKQQTCNLKEKTKKEQ